MKRFAMLLGAILWLPLDAAAETGASATTASPVWSSYLDYAYIFTSADAESLSARLDGYSTEAQVGLERYIEDYFETLAPLDSGEDETATRRKAVAYLLDYLSRGEPHSLGASVATIRELRSRLDRHENRYWYHYIHAHYALERGYASEFVQEVLALWMSVVVQLEAPYDTLETLSLSETPNSGFVSALPYIYENVARLILIRSQEMGIDRDLDALGAIVRLLADGRVGSHPDVIPPSASARDYLLRIVERVDGAESDGGSLTFTLALFEASKHHERALSELAENGLEPDTLRAMRRASGAYETALNRARTPQGHCAVYTRVLRQIGQLYTARQRLGVDPEIDMPFSIEGAIDVYATLRAGLDGEGQWKKLGYRGNERQLYVDAMRNLWEEIQEATLNTADYYLAQAVGAPHQADEHSRNAARIYTRYLAFFHRFATEVGKEAVPDSAYFAAFEAARGVGDAYLSYAGQPTAAEVDLATQRYRSALLLFPFDRELWPALTAALGRHGRESEYAGLVRPIADRVARSRSVNAWIEKGEANATEIAALRRALSDTLVIMYLGFAEAEAVEQLHAEVAELGTRRDTLSERLDRLTARRDTLRMGAVPAAPDPSLEGPDVAAPEVDDGLPDTLSAVARALADDGALLTKIEQQIAARTRALPLYEQTLHTDGFTGELRAQRDHPVHSLLRRMYHEGMAQNANAVRNGER